MNRELESILMKETTIEDIPDNFKPFIQIMGLEAWIKLSNYLKGDMLYVPKPENILLPARNRRIKKEYDGYNMKELAEKYDVTTRQIAIILKNEPVPGQLEMMDLFPGIEG